MKIISKINSISSLNDKNLEKFSLVGNNNNNNNRFLATKSSYIDSFDFLSGGSSTYNTLDTQQLSSVKSLKFNNNSDNSSASSAVFWDFTKPGVSSLPTSSSTNLRNTVSSSNLTLNSLSYAADNQTNQSTSSSSSTTIPLVIPQKFQFNQPQAQPVMKSLGSTSSSSSNSTMVQQQQQQHHHQDEQLQMLCSRKNSLPHSSNLINNNHTTNSNSSDLNNGVTKQQNTKLNQTSTSSSSIQVATGTGTVESLLHHHQHQQDQSQQQQQQQQNGTNQCTDLQQQQQHQQLQSKSQTMKCPVVASPHQVMMLYMNKLTPYEHHEIYKYPHIYFIGANAKKRSGTGPNDYDNENGSYIHIPHDHIAYRYEVLKIIGKGSFGQVVKAYDHKTLEHVALKMVRNEKRFHRQAQEEIRILKHLRAQDKENTFNIIHM